MLHDQHFTNNLIHSSPLLNMFFASCHERRRKNSVCEGGYALVCVCFLVIQQDYAKITQIVSIKFNGGMGPRKNPLNFSAHLDQFSISLSLTLRGQAFFNIFLNLSDDSLWTMMKKLYLVNLNVASLETVGSWWRYVLHTEYHSSWFGHNLDIEKSYCT